MANLLQPRIPPGLKIPGNPTSGPGGNVSGSPTTPSPPSSTTSPANIPGAELYFVPGKYEGKRTRSRDALAALAAFLVDPLGTVGLGIVGSLFKAGRPYQGQPVAVIRGEVVFNPLKLPGPQGRGISVFANDEKLNREKLQTTLDTGALQPGISSYYQELALELIKLHDEKHSGPPDIRTPIINPPGHDEEKPGAPLEGLGFPFFPFGSNQLSPPGEEDFFVPRFVRSIPGGAAGFAQQTPAGQRQMFGSGTSTGRRSRRKSNARRSSKRSQRRSVSRRSSRKPRPGTKAWMKYIRGLRKK